MTKEIILDKLEKVVNKLKNLDNPKIDKDNLKKEDFAKGIIKRDFGIDEWDWPQGVGIFGLNQLQKLYPDRFDNNNLVMGGTYNKEDFKNEVNKYMIKLIKES